MSLSDRATCRRRHRGFAFVWVIFAVALIGLGLATGMQLAEQTSRRDKERELLNVGREFRAAIGRYHEVQTAASTREYPSSLEDLLKDPRVPGVRRHLRKLYTDPMTGRSDWGLIKMNGRIVGVHSQSDGQPLKQAGFEGEDMAFAGKKRYSEWMFVHAAAGSASAPVAAASTPTSQPLARQP